MCPAPYVRKCLFMKMESKTKKKYFTSLEIDLLYSEFHKRKVITSTVTVSSMELRDQVWSGPLINCVCA